MSVKPIFRSAKAVRIAVAWDGVCEHDGAMSSWQSRHAILWVRSLWFAILAAVGSTVASNPRKKTAKKWWRWSS